MDKPSETPETIYLIPDASEGVLGYVWCDDPAPGIGMDAEDAVEYRRADASNTELTAANACFAELEEAFTWSMHNWGNSDAAHSFSLFVLDRGGRWMSAPPQAREPRLQLRRI